MDSEVEPWGGGEGGPQEHRKALEGFKQGRDPNSFTFWEGASWQERSVDKCAGRLPRVPGGEVCPGVGVRGQGHCSRQGSVAAEAERPEDSRALREQQTATHPTPLESRVWGLGGPGRDALIPFGLQSQNATDWEPYKQQTFISHSCGGWKSEITVPAGPVRTLFLLSHR